MFWQPSRAVANALAKLKFTTAQREDHTGYTIHRFPSGVGFAMGRDTHLLRTWRMDGEQHAYATIRNFHTMQAARDDLANRLRFHRLMLRAV